MRKKYLESYVIDIDGRLIVCTDGRVSADGDLVAQIKMSVDIGLQVRIVEPYGELITASLDPNDRIGTVAALVSPSPGRARVLKAPQEVWDYFDYELSSSEHDLKEMLEG